MTNALKANVLCIVPLGLVTLLGACASPTPTATNVSAGYQNAQTVDPAPAQYAVAQWSQLARYDYVYVDVPQMIETGLTPAEDQEARAYVLASLKRDVGVTKLIADKPGPGVAVIRTRVTAVPTPRSAPRSTSNALAPLPQTTALAVISEIYDGGTNNKLDSNALTTKVPLADILGKPKPAKPGRSPDASQAFDGFGYDSDQPSSKPVRPKTDSLQDTLGE